MIIGLFLRHIKAYKGIKFIPIGFEHNFVSYVGENGVGKSSILEALNSFFNNKKYIINKDARADSIFGLNNPFILPIFLIEKTKITKNKKGIEELSDFFWNIEKKELASGIQGSMREFFELREKIINKKDTHHLILIGETNLDAGYKISFGSFHSEENFLVKFLEKEISEIKGKTGEDRGAVIKIWAEELEKKLASPEWKRSLQDLKDLYSYIYLPVELDIETFTKMETDEMQKIFDKNLKSEIEKTLEGVNFENSGGINNKLDSLVSEIEETLNKKYHYDTGAKRGNTITKTNIVEKIIESYFQKRTLYKDGKKVSELSAGEKRQAVINLVYAFLVKTEERERMIIIAVDEPENSLHTSLCYDQFEKLQKISDKNQILITTHWYGYLPIVNRGIGHFLSLQEDGINFETYDLYDYKSRIKSDISLTKNKIPYNFNLKSTNDLVQSIFYSLNKDDPYNWLIVEGVSEKIYFEYFFKNEIENKKLRILCLGGQNKVSELYEYLELPIKNEKENLRGKIYCLIDTDQTRHKESIGDGYANLKIRRLSNKNTNDKTELLSLNNSDASACDIEQSLNPIIFQKTVKKLNLASQYQISNIEKDDGNTNFVKNFKNLEIENYFKENEGENKILFAREYLKVFSKERKREKYLMSWIEEIKSFFN